MKKIFYNWQQVQGACLEIVRQMQQGDWKPDYIVGITRGGAIPAILISQFLNVPMKPLMVNLRDNPDTVSDLNMAEDAYGYNGPVGLPMAKNILVVDDINDSGATIAWIKEDWQGSCLPNDERWNHVWGQNVRFATLTSNIASKESVDYSVWEVNKAEEDCWLVYPWEDYWL
ncbi:COG2236 Predicted phosphoribosyltransferases [uncultured Caudovirales phage]|uniref:COG2236 Predicted phosphoribosyltransferases n=1 Tax=uncultured Caudovirales phage TaxID=2100421 RepID=A0A6J5KTX5_9CAUD|nr:COG2236 Predicted phosphoribosyltransferases [uncultured Caudovirales phage]CAB5209027.1 COG2236 Predicted phosphoribosyltransferases [uncultured Caudovirales phage]